MESKLKHLEFIQNVITRMNSNSFLIKGWAITLISALFALAAKDANIQYVLITYIVIPIFWMLDGFFISQERQYRKLYEEVCLKRESEIDFSMNASKFSSGRNSWSSGILSKTLFPFYGITVAVTVIVMFFIGG
ncbi:hypothetical protein C9J48_27375 [Photobacterium profundum]|uniref:Uncharacterized protein n=1 Tax=Photobacterium profundum 3TCK TaxID=314280 RepID=Q1YVT6_9GAMM|nr:hypothetical protein [Photobacterium profundum]EAS40399.1 hypothetical protein P3TCK_19890 [Photobacterium profundum 3TCK]PSV56696.1 hypothetical protein C9J48_27375 [Photobacterium profundum]